jgi:hypothetical protein
MLRHVNQLHERMACPYCGHVVILLLADIDIREYVPLRSIPHFPLDKGVEECLSSIFIRQFQSQIPGDGGSSSRLDPSPSRMTLLVFTAA